MRQAHNTSDVHLPDCDLVNRARNRDETAVRILIQRYNRRLYRMVRSILTDDVEAEDALQDGYCKAFTALESFRGESAFSTWLTRIVVNEALARRRRRSLVLLPIDTMTDPSAQIIPFPQTSIADPERITAQREILQLLQRAIDELPEEFRTVLVARLVEGLTVAETAEAFSLRSDTVKTRLFRARALLRSKLADHIGPRLGDTFPFDGARCARVVAAVLDRLGWA